MVPIAQDDGVLGVVFVRFLLIVDEERGAKTVDVLTTVVAMHPVRAGLVSDGDFVGEGGTLWDGAARE